MGEASTLAPMYITVMCLPLTTVLYAWLYADGLNIFSFFICLAENLID